MNVADVIGRVVRIELFGGDITVGRVEAYADGVLFITGQDEIEVNGIKEIEVIR